MSAHAHKRVIDALDQHGCDGNGKQYRCPAHEDRVASLTVTDRADRVLLHCHAGCGTLAVLDALGLAWGALFDEPAAGKGWDTRTLRRVGAEANGDGRVTLGSVRYLPGAARGETKSLAVKGSRRDLWPDPATVKGDVVYVVEGEPDAVTAAQLGLPAVAIPGAGSWRPEWAARIAHGRERVVIVADGDQPGRTAARTWAAAIAEHCADVRVIDLAPGRTDGHDLSDFVAGAESEAERAQARRLIEDTARVARQTTRKVDAGVIEASSSVSTVESGSAPVRHVRQSLGTGADGAPSTDRYRGRILDVREMLARPDEPVPWRCRNLVADGYLTVLAGRGGEGKTWLALALAAGVARGKAAAGIDCAKGRALIFDAENGPRLIKSRWHAAAMTADLDVQPVDAGGLRFTHAGDMRWFREVIDREKADLVIFDSLRVLSSGSKESDGDEMEPVVTSIRQLARATGAAILLIHHRGKGDSDYRGSSVILDQTDMMFTLGRVEGDPDGRHRRVVRTAKCRIAEEPIPRWIKIEPGPEGLVFVIEAESFDATDVRPRDALRQEILDVLGGIPRSARSIAKAIGRAPNDSTIRRALDDLARDGLASSSPNGWTREIDPGVA